MVFAFLLSDSSVFYLCPFVYPRLQDRADCDPVAWLPKIYQIPMGYLECWADVPQRDHPAHPTYCLYVNLIVWPWGRVTRQRES